MGSIVEARTFSFEAVNGRGLHFFLQPVQIEQSREIFRSLLHGHNRVHELASQETDALLGDVRCGVVTEE